MARPKFYRDPIHGQLRYDSVDIGSSLPACGLEKRLGWLIQSLIDCPEFQRLRHIRQNGLANLVFHGAEHSRFTHGMGVAYLAREMFERISRNSDAKAEEERLLPTVAAALLHDIGHGPFSHALEEILGECHVEFDHERMTQRIIEEDTQVRRVLAEVDPSFPQTVAAYIDKKKRKEDRWSYRIVSSQLDADRLDYLLRDARLAGLQGHGFDLPRLLDFLTQIDGKWVGVDRRALEALEAYLVTLDHMYRAVYFHHTVRAASRHLESTIARAVDLHRAGDASTFDGLSSLVALVEKGDSVDLTAYLRVGEFQVWFLVDRWRTHKDPVLADLSRALVDRSLPKTIELNVERRRKLDELEARAKSLTMDAFDHVDEATVKYYVYVDSPDRTSYKQYNWGPEEPDESIWFVDGGTALPVDEYSGSKVLEGLKQTRYFPRLMVPAQIRDQLDGP